VPPLQHAHARLEEVTQADLDLAARFIDQALIALGDMVMVSIIFSPL